MISHLNTNFAGCLVTFTISQTFVFFCELLAHQSIHIITCHFVPDTARCITGTHLCQDRHDPSSDSTQPLPKVLLVAGVGLCACLGDNVKPSGFPG